MSLSRFFAVLLIFPVISGCVTVSHSTLNELSGWTDYHYTDALHQLGYPSYVFSERPGSIALVYDIVHAGPESHITVPEDSLSVYQQFIVGQIEHRPIPVRLLRSHDVLYVDGSGLIYSFQSNYSSGRVREAMNTNVIIAGVVLSLVIVGILILTPQSQY